MFEIFFIYYILMFQKFQSYTKKNFTKLFKVIKIKI